jgi:hypothetical protein
MTDLRPTQAASSLITTRTCLAAFQGYFHASASEILIGKPSGSTVDGLLHRVSQSRWV